MCIIFYISRYIWFLLLILPTVAYFLLIQYRASIHYCGANNWCPTDQIQFFFVRKWNIDANTFKCTQLPQGSYYTYRLKKGFCHNLFLTFLN